MATVRKKPGKPRKDGSRSTSWVVSWYESTGQQRERYFKTKAKAKEFAATKTLDPGQHHDQRVEDRAKLFVDYYEDLHDKGQRARATFEEVEQHINDHLLTDTVARTRMSELDAPILQSYFDRLAKKNISLKTARKIAGTVKRMIKWSALRGVPAKSGADAAHIVKPSSNRLTRPADIPTKEECRAILDAADANAFKDRGRSRAALRVLMLSGLRVGELRGLDWSDLDLSDKTPRVRVRRSVDKWNKIKSMPKTDSSIRSVSLSPQTAAALRTWKQACPATRYEVQQQLEQIGASGALVFPSAKGTVWNNAGMYRNMWSAILRKAGLATPKKSKTKKSHPNGDYYETIWAPDYPMKQARHVAASVAIANGASAKWVMTMMGHSTYKLTMDLYGHLFPDTEEDSRMAAAADRAFD